MVKRSKKTKQNEVNRKKVIGALMISLGLLTLLIPEMVVYTVAGAFLVFGISEFI